MQKPYFCLLENSILNDLLSHINSPRDLKKLSEAQLPQLAQELREFIIDTVALKGGHLGASLGVIELTIGLHYIFDTPEDLLVWDVGHQAYGHKILTGRRNLFHTNRQLHGLSGFPKRGESPYDSFGVGHASTSISAALGMAIASKLQGKTERQHIAVIGDASFVGGMAFEGLNHAGITDANLLIVLNDNAIGIDPSVGAFKDYLTRIKADTHAAQDNIIKALNFNYFGPLDGHNFEELLSKLQQLKLIKGPRLLHIVTTKGKGLRPAEENQVVYHAPGKFDKVTGELSPKTQQDQPPKYQDVFGHSLVELAQTNENIIGITPAMPTGSSLKYMMESFPDRAFDVGIAEQHAVTLAAGMATQGIIPFCNIYSSFLQRAYDQVIHDVALQSLAVIFCLDRAGLVGQDGPTHHGSFDIAYLRCIPNLIIMAPMNEEELRNIMYTAQLGLNQPIAIRYPRGRGVMINWRKPFRKMELAKAETLKEGSEVAVLSVGHIGNNVTQAIANLTVKARSIGHYNMRFIKPLDEKLLHQVCKNYPKLITVEDACITGGFGSAIMEFVATHQYKNTIVCMGLPDRFISHGTVHELQQLTKIDVSSIEKTLLQYL